jgi:putative transcriptional regulator
MQFNTPYNSNLDVTRGHLLISEPFLPDKNFERSVVLVCEHQPTKGSFGLVLNKSTEMTVSDVVEVSSFEQTLYIGGPVEQNTLHFVHTLSEIPNAVPLRDGVFWGGDFNYIKSLAIANRLSPTNSRFFVGYSGWGEGQLTEELKENAWILSTINLQIIFQVPTEELWKQILKNMGGRFKVVANYPTNPRLN